MSVLAHVGVVAAIFTAKVEATPEVDLRLMNVSLIELPPPADPIAPPSPPEPSPATTPPQKSSFRETKAPAPPDAEPMPAGDDEVTTAGVSLSDAAVSGAATAGSGQAGGACNMPRLIENALRKDPLVRAAVAKADRGQALLLWNGDWVRHPGQEGAGLTAVREAVMWEVGFAPAACRAEPVRGLVLISLGDGPGSARIVLGAGHWRWTDLLFARNTRSAMME
jgi:hypothetical protein